MHKLLFLLLLLPTYFVQTSYWTKDNIKHKAVVIVPVADVATKSLAFLAGDQPVEHAYTFSCSPETGPHSCARVAQLLFNEVVEIQQDLGDEVLCKVNNFFYEGPLCAKINTFCIVKKHLRPLEQQPIEAIPQPYTQDFIQVLPADNLIILTLPWKDPITRQVYSVGTRFIHVPTHDNQDSYGVSINYIADTQTKTVITHIPHTMSVRGYPATKKEQVTRFVTAVRKWALAFNIIAYIWGGCSLTKTYTDGAFSLASIKRANNDEITCWIRPEHTQPHSGFDCSGLVLRAAQIAGLPYFFKNTTTLSRNLPELTNIQDLTNGDLLFYEGHVMIVSDITNNEIIEAAGYGSGYGKVHAIKLSQAFGNTVDYSDLLALYRNTLPLKRLKAQGLFSREIPSFKLLALTK